MWEGPHVSMVPPKDWVSPANTTETVSVCLGGQSASVSWNVSPLMKTGYCCLNYPCITPCTPVISHHYIREMDGKVPRNSGCQRFPRHQNVKKQTARLKTEKAPRFIPHFLHRQAELTSKIMEKVKISIFKNLAHLKMKAILKIWHRVILGGLEQKGWKRQIWSIL